MARGGINKALVKKAKQAILARGEKPSIDAIRIELGNTGSKTTIHRYLKELAGTDTPESPPPSLSEQLTSFIAHLVETLEQEAQASVALEREVLAQEKIQIDIQLRLNAERITQLEHLVEQSSAENSTLQIAYESTLNQLHQTEIDKAGLQQLVAAQEIRLVEKDQAISSLEEKHHHTRDALEHYRQATKEQRDQEQHRHAGQLQQLQMEVRQLQQSLIVRQNESTRLNRDNERLLAENHQATNDYQYLQQQYVLQQEVLSARHNELAQLLGAKTLLEEQLKSIEKEVRALNSVIGANSFLEKQIADLEQELFDVQQVLKEVLLTLEVFRGFSLG